MSERFTRVVGRAGTIAVKGKEYVIDEPGFAGEMVIVHYDPESETVEKVMGMKLVELNVRTPEWKWF
jgi:hypothetical protein